jgi:hypothetical protein
MVEIRETALGAFLREWVDRVVKQVAAIHAVVRGGDLNASHGRTLVTDCWLDVAHVIAGGRQVVVDGASAIEDPGVPEARK